MKRRGFLAKVIIPGLTITMLGVTLRNIRNYLGQRQGFSGCLRCGDTWNWKEEHTTYFPDGSGGMFPLCQECWEELKTPVARKPYYKKLIEQWAFMIILDIPQDRQQAAWQDHMRKVMMYEKALELEAR